MRENLMTVVDVTIAYAHLHSNPVDVFSTSHVTARVRFMYDALERQMLSITSM